MKSEYAAAAGLLSVALLSLGCNKECRNTVPPNTAIAIVTPCNDSTVSWHRTITGIARKPQQTTVDVVIHPLETSTYWAQPKIDVGADGTWRVETYFGRDGAVDRGKHFELKALTNCKPRPSEGQELPG